jgi:hypothetical protein
MIRTRVPVTASPVVPKRLRVIITTVGDRDQCETTRFACPCVAQILRGPSEDVDLT